MSKSSSKAKIEALKSWVKLYPQSPKKPKQINVFTETLSKQ